MSLRPLLAIVLSLASAAHVYAAPQDPGTTVTVPRIAWQLGNLSGLKMKRGQVVDGFLRYYVTVPEGTAGSYSVSVDYCEWKPVPGNVPDETDFCSPADPIPVAALTELEPGKVYEGQFYYSLEPGDLEFKKINRLSFTLTLRRTDGPVPDEVVGTQELNLLVFAGGKSSGV